MKALGLPLALLAEAMLDDLPGECLDTVAAFRQGDELVGHDHAAQRMLPAHESLRAAEPAAGEVDLGLIDEMQLALGQSIIQLIE